MIHPETCFYSLGSFCAMQPYEGSFYYSHRYTNLVCLPQLNNHVPVGSKCWITGWGTLSSGGSQPENLQQAEVPIVHKDICTASYPGQIDDSMICAGLQAGGVDACQGKNQIDFTIWSIAINFLFQLKKK